MQLVGVLLFTAEADAPGRSDYATHTAGPFSRGTRILAHCALTSCAPGVSSAMGKVGAAAIYIRRWEVYGDSGEPYEHKNTDQAQTVRIIDNCRSVTFQLGVNYARARGNALIYSL